MTARGCPFGSLFGRTPKTDAPSLARRRMLLGLGAAGGTLGLAGTAVAAPAADTTPALENDGTQERQPFYGSRQPGIVNPEPAAALVVAFDVIAGSRAELQRLCQVLTERIAFLMQGGPAAVAGDLLPPPDSGLLGPEIIPDNLTVTVSVGASLFDDRFGLASLRPGTSSPCRISRTTR